jgi:hypothetical protein
MSLAQALTDKVAGIPIWLLAVVFGGGLYWFAHYQQTKGQTTIYTPLLAMIDPTLTAHNNAAISAPAVSNGNTNTQEGAGLFQGPFATNIPVPPPVLSGGDNPFVTGYVGLRIVDPYTTARFGPS